ncbi:MAG TPA: hypothetical protein VGP24_02940 [Glaciihabitans sp.]|jgi:hypothetical protein|nr:hypothetical protein [Glaciihabitans sp.]
MDVIELMVCGECSRRMQWITEESPWGEARIVFCRHCDDAMPIANHLRDMHIAGVTQELFELKVGGAPHEKFWPGQLVAHPKSSRA